MNRESLQVVLLDERDFVGLVNRKSYTDKGSLEVLPTELLFVGENVSLRTSNITAVDLIKRPPNYFRIVVSIGIPWLMLGFMYYVVAFASQADSSSTRFILTAPFAMAVLFVFLVMAREIIMFIRDRWLRVILKTDNKQKVFFFSLSKEVRTNKSMQELAKLLLQYKG